MRASYPLWYESTRVVMERMSLTWPRHEYVLVRMEGRRPELMTKGQSATTEPIKSELMRAKLRLLRRRVKAVCYSSSGWFKQHQ